MASGDTLTTALTDSLPSIRQSARIVREFEGVMPNLCDRQRLDEGEGLSWNEMTYAQLTAQAVNETTDLDNPQQMSDTLLTITPTQIGIHTFISNRVKQRIAKIGYAKLGQLAMNAIQRKKDEDLLVALDGATTSLCGSGTTLNSGYIRAATRRITSNTTEPATGPIHCVLHGYQLKDLEDEIVASIGTYPLTDGPTASVFRENFQGVIGTARLFEDGNITITSNDAKGGVFAREALVLVEGHSVTTYTRFEPSKGGGGTSLWIYDEYAVGERNAGGWLFELLSDATAPTG